jgi:glycosyltransferase involved in cell wall biosynthesis
MSEINISYLVTCKNEGEQLNQLLNLLSLHKENNECIILEDNIEDINTLNAVEQAIKRDPIFFQRYNHSLDNNYGEHKNYGKSKCRGKYIFQIDADELPNEFLLEVLPEILDANADVDLFWLPRVNDFTGVNEKIASEWGWRLTPYENRLIVNWPDIQSRIFKNVPYLKWERKLHEKVEGAKTYSYLPAQYEFSLHHKKTIEKQVQTNIRYNEQFSITDNKGYKL